MRSVRFVFLFLSSYGFRQPDVRNRRPGLPGNGTGRAARFHCGAATAGQRPAARVAKAGQPVGVHGLPRQVVFKVRYGPAENGNRSRYRNSVCGTTVFFLFRKTAVII